MERIPVALQLWSVRDEIKKDYFATLEAVKKIGYDGVELFGPLPEPPQELGRRIRDLGLAVAGRHIRGNEELGAHAERTIEDSLQLGAPFLIVATYGGRGFKGTRADWMAKADELNRLAERLAPTGMRIGFHNHTAEFNPVEGEVPWEILFDRTRPDVVMQFDVGNSVRGKLTEVPLHYFSRYPGRARTVHLKEYSPSDKAAEIGEGTVPWPDVFRLAESVGGTEWYVVEQAAWRSTSLDAAAGCLRNLRNMGR